RTGRSSRYWPMLHQHKNRRKRPTRLATRSNTMQPAMVCHPRWHCPARRVSRARSSRYEASSLSPIRLRPAVVHSDQKCQMMSAEKTVSLSLLPLSKDLVSSELYQATSGRNVTDGENQCCHPTA